MRVYFGEFRNSFPDEDKDDKFESDIYHYRSGESMVKFDGELM